jgi:lysozyme family protein
MFKDILPIVLRHEGGFVNDPLDRGGATNKGIIQRTYDAWRRSKDQPIRPVKEITDEEVEAIYYSNYWLDGLCDRMPIALGTVHFDFAVNAGVGQAFRTLQRIIGTTVDGQFGPKSFQALGEAIRTRGLLWLVNEYSDERVAFYISITERRPENLRFLRGWFYRTIAVRDYALSYIPQSNITIV